MTYDIKPGDEMFPPRPMTPQEALAAALWDADDGDILFGIDSDKVEVMAAAILDALPEGWALTTEAFESEMLVKAHRDGAQQERDRLRPVLEAAQALYDCAADDDVCIRHSTIAVIRAVRDFGGDLLADPEPDR